MSIDPQRLTLARPFDAKARRRRRRITSSSRAGGLGGTAPTSHLFHRLTFFRERCTWQNTHVFPVRLKPSLSYMASSTMVAHP